jgi:hypothetical protein
LTTMLVIPVLVRARCRAVYDGDMEINSLME